MLAKRIITALALLPAVYLLLFNTRLDFFAAIIIVVVYLMALEWSKLSNVSSAVGGSFFALGVSCINLAIWSFSESILVWPSISWPYHVQTDLPLVFLFVAVFMVLAAIGVVLSFSSNNRWWQSAGIKSLFGFILLPAFFVSFVSLRNIGYDGEEPRYGGSLLLFMLLMIWAADTGAFVTGKLFGKHKLTQVSPNKTWEGMLGGLILSTSVGWAGISVLGLDVSNMPLYLTVVFLLAVLSVFGDLFESALKRVAHIKDSGNLLPGHGGLLDRLDSTITVAPVFYLSFSYFEWFHA